MLLQFVGVFVVGLVVGWFGHKWVSPAKVNAAISTVETDVKNKL